MPCSYGPFRPLSSETRPHGTVAVRDWRIRKTKTQHVRFAPLVKAHPTPSERYGEAVCVAGARIDGPSIRCLRLYPVQFRDLPEDQQFSEYAILELDVLPHSDFRPESHRPLVDTIRRMGELGVQDRWRARREVVEPLLIEPMCELARRPRGRSDVARGISAGGGDQFGRKRRVWGLDRRPTRLLVATQPVRAEPSPSAEGAMAISLPLPLRKGLRRAQAGGHRLGDLRDLLQRPPQPTRQGSCRRSREPFSKRFRIALLRAEPFPTQNESLFCGGVAEKRLMDVADAHALKSGRERSLRSLGVEANVNVESDLRLDQPFDESWERQALVPDAVEPAGPQNPERAPSGAPTPDGATSPTA